jgi:hypothetical protein
MQESGLYAGPPMRTDEGTFRNILFLGSVVSGWVQGLFSCPESVGNASRTGEVPVGFKRLRNRNLLCEAGFEGPYLLKRILINIPF